MNNLFRHLNPTGRIYCFTNLLSRMALSEWDFMSNDDPWKVSVFVSAIVELFLSILLLLGAAISFITSRFAKFFGLEPPCTYMGCSHPLHSESLGQRLPTCPSCKSKDLCIGKFCPDCRSLRIHSTLHSNSGTNQEDGSCSKGSPNRSSCVSRDCGVTDKDLDVSNSHLAFSGEHHEMQCSCSHGSDSLSYKRQNLQKGLSHRAFGHSASSSKLNEDDLPSISARSGSESSGGYDEVDYCEISRGATGSEDCAWKDTCAKENNVMDGDASSAHDLAALKRNMALEDLDQSLHHILPSLSKSNGAGSVEPLPCCAVLDEVEGPKNNLVSHGANLADLEKQWRLQCSGKADDGDCLETGLIAAYLSSSELSSQESITEGLQEASLEGAHAPCEKDDRVLEGEKAYCGAIETNCDLKQGKLSRWEAIKEGLQGVSLEGAYAPCEKDDRLSEGEQVHCGAIELNCDLKQQELSMKEHGKVVEGMIDATISADNCPDEFTSADALAEWGRSSKHVKERALSVPPLEGDKEDEEFTLEEEGQEEGLEALKVALQAERSVLAALETELENERNAAAVATSEAMAMISRLQEEKSVMQLEVAQLQRMSEEKAEYDEQTMVLLKEILFKREKENIVLEKEVKLYRETLLAEKADELKQIGHCEVTGSPLPQSIRTLLLAGGEEAFLSPNEAASQKQVCAFSEFSQSGTRSPPWKAQCQRSLDFEELNAFSLDQNLNKRSIDSPVSDTALSMFSRLWNDEARPRFHSDGGLHGMHNNSDQLKKMRRSVSLTNDKDAQLILARLSVLEEELQDLRGKNGRGSQKAWSKMHGVEQLVDKGFPDAWGGQEINSKEQREGLEMDGIADGFVPIHDVYEVHSASNCSLLSAEERDRPDGSESIPENAELPPGCISESFPPATIPRHQIQIPPRVSQARKPYTSDETPCTPDFMPKPAGWIVGKRSHSDDIWDNHDLHTQALVTRDEWHMAEEIQQLAARLKALEEDRELLRETLESFKHRDAELNVLQEIAKHLRELRMEGFMNGFFSEDVSSTSSGKSRALKKRRFCSGPGHPQTLPL